MAAYGINLPMDNTKALNIAELSVPVGSEVNYSNKSRKVASGIYTGIPKPMPDILRTGLRNQMEMVLPAKGLKELVTYGRPERPKNDYIQAPSGYARNQAKGLQYDPNHPIDGPITPIAGYYDPDMLNVLGGLK